MTWNDLIHLKLKSEIEQEAIWAVGSYLHNWNNQLLCLMAIIWGKAGNNGLFFHVWKYMSAKLTEFGIQKMRLFTNT